jgi:uncharacterized membrane protein
MAAKSTTLLSADHLRRIRSGLTLLLWTCWLSLFSSVLGPLTRVLYGGYTVGWTGMFGSILGIIAISRIRSVFRELIPGELRVPAPVAAPAPAPAAKAAMPAKAVASGGFQAAKLSSEPVRKPQSKVSASPQPSLLQNVNWEEWIGKKLLQKVGILVVLIGMIVLLKYSFDNRIIGELGRLALAVVGAIALMATGEWFYRKYPLWAQTFTGGGLALLYFTVWAGHVLYKNELLAEHGIWISPLFAMILYSLITLIGAFAAIRYRSQTIAWFTLLGGYLTPFLIQGVSQPTMLVVYLAILAGGLLTLSWHKKWPYLTMASFILTQFYLFSMVYDAGVVSDAKQVTFAIGFFALFALPPLLSQFRLKVAAAGGDIGLILLDGATAYVAVVDALGGFGGQYTGIVTLLLATIYVGFAAMALNKRSEDALLVNTYLVSGIGLIALALFAQMEARWVAAGWAPLSVLLLWVAMTLKRRSVFTCAGLLLGGSLAFLAVNVPMMGLRPEEIWHPFTSHWALLSYVVFGCLLAWIGLSKKLPKEVLPSQEFSEQMLPSLHAVVAVLLFAAVTFEATRLRWVIDLPVMYSYLGFAVLGMALFAFTGRTVWFVAAFLTQGLLLLFLFVFGDGSGMLIPGIASRSVAPFFHPWGLMSLLTMLATVGMFVAATRGKNQAVNTVQMRGLLLGIVASQIWLHVTIEINHLQETLRWAPTVHDRVLSAWWILFTVPIFAWGFYRNQQVTVRAAIFALCIPFLKDLFLIMGNDASMYEVGLWTVIPLVLAGIATHIRNRELLVVGGTMLAVTMGVDMLHTLGSQKGLLRTIWWALAGLVTMSLGFAQRERFLRRLAMIIFAATVVKLLLFDFSALSTIVRIVASILTGLLMIGASYLYQRFDSQLGEAPGGRK